LLLSWLLQSSITGPGANILYETGGARKRGAGAPH
jgi:hypothetical protein